ncbi:MAG: Fic family protein [bacterium]|nr:Fic family protein [bacterium]
MSQKISIRFFNDQEVRAAWDEATQQWLFSIADIIGILTESTHPRKYWSVLKARLKKKHPELTTNCSQLKMVASDGKWYRTDCFSQKDVLRLVEHLPNRWTVPFIKWLTYSDETIDGKSRSKAYTLFESGLLESLEPGSIKCLQQIHAYLFGGLYDFAGQIRTKNIRKGDFTFGACEYFHVTLPLLERMPERTFEEIIDKYVEMNIAHPFMEGNGRSTRIWLDLMLKRTLRRCVDWSQVNKYAYLQAMRESVTQSQPLKNLLRAALTDKINDRELFMKGIDYSYYYESEAPSLEPQNGLGVN